VITPVLNDPRKSSPTVMADVTRSLHYETGAGVLGRDLGVSSGYRPVLAVVSGR